MFLSKGVVSLGLVMGALVLSRCLQAQPPQQPEAAIPEVSLPALLKSKPIKVDKKDDELHRLLKERYNEALAEMTRRFVAYQIKGEQGNGIYSAGKRLVKAGLELKEKPEEQTALLRQYIEVLKDLEKRQDALVAVGRIELSELHKARYYRLDAEIQLLRLEKKGK